MLGEIEKIIITYMNEKCFSTKEIIPNYKEIFENLFRQFLQKTGLREEDINITEESPVYEEDKDISLVFLSGPTEEKLDSEEFKFIETKDRNNILSARKVIISGKTLYLLRAATVPQFRMHGASTLLLAYVLSCHPNIDQIIVPYIAGKNMEIYKKEGINNMPISKTLKRLGFQIEPQLYYDYGEPELRTKK